MRSLRSQKYKNKTIEITDVVYNIQMPSLTTDNLSKSDEYIQVTLSVHKSLDTKQKHIKTRLNYKYS